MKTLTVLKIFAGLTLMTGMNSAYSTSVTPEEKTFWDCDTRCGFGRETPYQVYQVKHQYRPCASSESEAKMEGQASCETQTPAGYTFTKVSRFTECTRTENTCSSYPMEEENKVEASAAL